MDIYNYINSRDIAEHCRNINHKFNAMEASFIVHWSWDLALSEKHNLYNEIIATMPDMEIGERNNCPHYQSLHGFLREYMKLENRIIDTFKSETDNAIYNISIWYKGSDDWFDCEFPYSTLSKALSVIKAENEISTLKIQKWMITKCPLDIDMSKCNELMCVETNSNGEILRRLCGGSLSDNELDLNDSFEGMWIEIPTPFKEGDIVFGSSPYSIGGKFNREPFVLDSICCWDVPEKRLKSLREDADVSDMIAYGYWIDKDGCIYNECMHSYQELEHYRGELTGEQRILTAISNHIKDKIDYGLLLNSYDAIRSERLLGSNNLHWYTDEGKKLAGL